MWFVANFVVNGRRLSRSAPLGDTRESQSMPSLMILREAAVRRYERRLEV